MNKALILLSGGQDSTTCLYWAKKKFDSIQAIGFNYGQRHVIELDFAKKICDKENISFDIISLKEILSNSALINPQEDLNKSHPSNQNLPNSFVPGRNLLFLSIASSIAYNREIENIVMGHPNVSEAAVIGIKHKKWNERPLLLIVKVGKLEKKDVVAFLEDKIVKWWMPDEVVFVDNLPHTATGKIKKVDLKEEYKNLVLEN